MAGQVPSIGPAWQASGQALPTISGGKLIGPTVGDTSYLFAFLQQIPSTVSAEFNFSGGTILSENPMTIAYCNDTTFTINDTLHLNFGPQAFTLAIRQGGGAFNTVITDSWLNVMNNTGTTYKVSLAVSGNRCVVTGPSNEVWNFSDSRVPTVAGNSIFYEPTLFADGLSCQVSRAYAYKNIFVGYTDYASFNPADLFNITLDQANNRATASANATLAQVRTASPNANNLVYFEVKTSNVSNPSSASRAFGISTAGHSYSNQPGTDNLSCAFYIGSTITFYYNNVGITVATGGAMQADSGNILAFAFDFTHSKAWMKNVSKGTGWNNDILANQNPATNTGGQSFPGIGSGPYYIIFELYQISDSFWLNTGQMTYAGTPPAGFGNWVN